MLRRLPAGLWAGLTVAGLLQLSACQDSPYKAETWIKKLSSAHDAERAVTELENLGDPKAIEPLAKAWEEQGKPGRILQVIIALAHPLTPAEAKERYVVDYTETGRKASWEAALPVLKKAVADVDESNPRSVESAEKAAAALGEAQLADGLDTLVEVINKPSTKKILSVQLAAIRALGGFTNDKARAAAILTKLIDREPPPNPRTASDKQVARAMQEKFEMFLSTTAMAINGLGALRSPNATKVLILAMYRTPELYSQLRRALVASGAGAVPELRKVLRGEHAEVNQLFADKKLDRYCGDAGTLTGDECKPVSLRDFYAATILGDFYDPSATPELLAALKRPALPFYYQDDTPGPNTQYNAILDALKKIGAADAAADVRAMWMDAKAELIDRAMAINAYPFLTRDGAGTDELGKIAADNKANDDLRQAAAESFARLSADPKQVGILQGLADKYHEASAKKKAELEGLKASFDAAEKEFAAAKKAQDDATAATIKITQDKSSTAEAITKATAAGKAAKDAFKAAKAKHGEAVRPYRNTENMVKGYHQYARMFETHIARIEVAMRCKEDLACYAKTLGQKPDEAVAHLKPFIKDVEAWTPEEKKGLVPAQIERAMLELGKRGQKASSFTEALLDSVISDDVLTRQSILLALPKVAKVPCDTCEKKLQAAVKAGEGKAALAGLNLETTMLMNYFSWAGGKAPPAEAPKPE